MNIFFFEDGIKVTTKLSLNEYLKRYNRLDYLRVLVEGYDEGEGYSIFKKALSAENKNENFTGIIRLNHIEKEFLSYVLDSATDQKDIETLNYYIRVWQHKKGPEKILVLFAYPLYLATIWWIVCKIIVSFLFFYVN